MLVSDARGSVSDVLVRLEVGDPLQPARYHAVLADLASHRKDAGSARDARIAARKSLLRSTGIAQALVTHRCDHEACWTVSGSGERVCLPADVDPEVLVAACLHVCPAAGLARLHRRGRRTQIGSRWPFDLDRAADLVRRATHAAHGRQADGLTDERMAI